MCHSERSEESRNFVGTEHCSVPAHNDTQNISVISIRDL